jgi:hypothetical protein
MMVDCCVACFTPVLHLLSLVLMAQGLLGNLEGIKKRPACRESMQALLPGELLAEG